MHLFGNMVFLFVFGNAINAKLGHAGFLASYLGIGVVENLVWRVLGHGAACLGASAAIMGLCGMFFVLYPVNTIQVFWDDFEIAFLVRSFTSEIPGWIVVLIYLGFDLWGTVFDRRSGVGYLSHIIGGLLGAALAIILLKSEWIRPDVGEQTLLQWLAGEGPVEPDTPRPGKKRRKSRSRAAQASEEKG